MTQSARLIRAPSASTRVDPSPKRQRGVLWTDRWPSDPLIGGTPMLPIARGSDQVPDMSDITLHFADSRAA